MSQKEICHKTLMLYSLLRKESTKIDANFIVLRAIADECLESVKVLSAVNPFSSQARALELLEKSMQHILSSLGECVATKRDSHVSVSGEETTTLMDCADGNWGISSASSSLSPGYSAQEADVDESHRKSAVEDTILKAPNVSFKNVVGLVEAKRTLHEAVVIPSLFPQLFIGNRRPWQRILLYGPPGTGKTRLAQAMAGEIQSTFYSVSSSDLLSCWFGESEKLIRDLFAHSHKSNASKPTIIFMDEIDGLCRKRSAGEQDQTRRIKTELLMQMDSLGQRDTSSGKISDVIIICATNSPWEIDKAFLRRFQKRIYIPLPDSKSRSAILQLHCNATESKMTQEEWDILGAETEGFSGSDLATLANSALFEPIRDLENAKYWAETGGNKYQQSSQSDTSAIRCSLGDIPQCLVTARPLEFSDFKKSLLTNAATVTGSDLAQFEEFTTRFGHSGM